MKHKELHEEYSGSKDSNISDVSQKRKSDRQIENNKKKPRIKNLFRQPTNEELTQLRETENLFNSNLFRMQVIEILNEVKVKPKTVTKFQKWFDMLNKALESLPEDELEYNLDEQKLLKKFAAKFPISYEPKESKAKIKFEKCGPAEIIGSYKLDCCISTKLSIDLAVKMPPTMFTKNDSVNYRYHRKKAAYIVYIASYLTTLDIIEEVSYTLSNRTELIPILLIKPKGKFASRFSVKIHFWCSEEVFKLTRFSLDRNNVRESWFLGINQQNCNSNYLGPVTPYYNSSVLHDITQNVNHNIIENTFLECENLKQAIILLKIWLRQRCLDVSGYIFSMLFVYLVQMRRVNNIMSSYQIVRNVWIYLRNSKWDDCGISLLSNKIEDALTVESFHKYHDVVFLDATGHYNILWNMSRSTYMALRRESSLAIKMLDNSNNNSFIPLFMTSFKFNLQFDHIFSFNDSMGVITSIYEKINNDDKINYGPDKKQLVIKKITEVLNKGLNNRIHLLLEKPDDHLIWPVAEQYKKMKKSKREQLTFGLILNPEECLNNVVKGPEANKQEASEFRSFWGDKSELRRFQDGSITEACVFECNDTMANKRLLTKQIIQYLLEYKFGLKNELYYIADQLDSMIMCKSYLPSDYNYGTGEEASVRVLQAFDNLRKDLRSITELPLYVNSVYGISPVFSYCETFPPLGRSSPPHYQHWYRERCCLIKEGKDTSKMGIPSYVKTSHAVIELGHSGKWPGELEAFRYLKAAFHVQIAETLANKFSVSTHAFPDHIIVVKDGLIFKLEIAHSKEITLSRRYIKDGVVKYRETEESIQLATKYTYLPRLRGALHGIHQNHPSFGATVSLVKRFLNSHLIDDYHFPEIALELLCAHLFINCEPYSVPVQPVVGFQRFLHMMSNVDWNVEMIVLNFNNDISKENLLEVEKNFNDKRSSLPQLCIVTPYELEIPSVWTRRGPTVNVIARVQLLAKVALDKLYEKGAQFDDNVLSLFKPSMSGYNLLIKLRKECIVYYNERIDVRPEFVQLEAPSQEDKTIAVHDFDPVQKYLNQLRVAYNEFALFFYDQYGGDVIAVLWRPEVFVERDFQVLRSNGIKPKKESDKFEVNIKAIINDFDILGKGIVEQIQIM